MGEQIEVSTTKKERDLLKHTFGCSNTFGTDEESSCYPILKGLVERGLMVTQIAPAWMGGHIFRCTDAGKKESEG